MEIIINSNDRTSKRDFIDLRVLLNELKDRYNFNWHLNTYAKKDAKGEDQE